MKYYPINLDLKGKKCLVVGGGRVAERRVISLLECEADVIVISPRVTPKLERLSVNKKITYKSRSYKPSDLRGAYLIIASTDNQKLNRHIGERERRYKKAEKVLMNIAGFSFNELKLSSKSQS